MFGFLKKLFGSEAEAATAVIEKEPETNKPLFEKIGGEAAVNAAVDLFYRKVLTDEELSPFFEGVDMAEQHKKQKVFLTFAFGGPANYTGKDMTMAHAKLVKQGMNEKHFDLVIKHLGATLTELEVPADLIGEAAKIAEDYQQAASWSAPVLAQGGTVLVKGSRSAGMEAVVQRLTQERTHTEGAR